MLLSLKQPENVLYLKACCISEEIDPCKSPSLHDLRTKLFLLPYLPKLLLLLDHRISLCLRLLVELRLGLTYVLEEGLLSLLRPRTEADTLEDGGVLVVVDSVILPALDLWGLHACLQVLELNMLIPRLEDIGIDHIEVHIKACSLEGCIHSIHIKLPCRVGE